jgi:hypothetical protein
MSIWIDPTVYVHRHRDFPRKLQVKMECGPSLTNGNTTYLYRRLDGQDKQIRRTIQRYSSQED